MSDSQVTVVGNVTADPVVGHTKGNDVFVSFSVAVDHGYFDRGRQQWMETGTSFYKVSAFRNLAVNAFESLGKGTPVVVQGKLRVVNWENGEKQGTSAQIDAVAIGPNLTFGQADFTAIKRPVLGNEDPMNDPNVRGAMEGPASDDYAQQTEEVGPQHVDFAETDPEEIDDEVDERLSA